MIRRIFALLIGLVVCINLAWIQPVAGAVDYSIIRVMLSSMGTPSKVSLRVEGEYSIPQLGDRTLDKGSYEIYVEGGQLVLKNNSTARVMGSKFTFKSKKNSFSNYLRILNNSYGWTNYLGDMEVRLVDGGIQLINHIFLEYYLYGVVPYEMSNSWPIEALKAQAVAARTYAARAKTSSSYYDLYDTVLSQVYRGYNPSWQNAIRAVDETYGMVLKYGNSFASTFYSSSNGGKIEACGNLWSQHLPYSVVKDDPYDVKNPSNPNATWTVKFSKLSVDPGLQARIKSRMKDDLEKSGYSGNEGDIKILQLKELSFDPPNSSGRMDKGRLVVVADVKSKEDGSTHTIEYTVNLTKNNIRTLLNLKSLLFTVEETEDSYILHGGGYGHGVGMSQFGAQQMAREGFSFAQILDFYYPGTRLETLAIAPPNPDSGGGDKEPEPSPKDPEPEPKEPEEPQPQEPEDPNQPEPVYGIVKVTTSLNVRQGPGLHYARIGSLSPNTRVQILEQGTEWHKIKAGNLVGYVSSQYIKIENEEQTQPQEPGQGQNPVKPEDPAPPPEKRYGIVTASALNIRSGPSTRNHKIGMVVRGTRLTIIGQSGEWYKVQVNGLEGYVHGDYVKLETDNPSTPPSSKPPVQVIGKAVVTASSLNVRTGPGTGHGIITSLPRNTEVELLEQQGEWYKIRRGSTVGYVHGGYLKINNSNNSGGSGSSNPAPSKTGTVNASALNVRTGPGTSYQRIALLPRGAKVTILQEVNGWYQIRHGNTIGYVSAQYISL